MSSVAFGALTTRREKSDSGKSKSEQPPGLNSYIDILAALVPAEVLAIEALVIAAVTKTNAHGQTQITEPATLRLAFWLLIGLSMALFILGRRPVPTPAAVGQASGGGVSQLQHWEWQDLIRLVVPPAAFVGWTMLEPTSVWNAVVPSMPSGMRILVPLVGAVLLAAVTKALATHADKKLSMTELSEQTALKQAAQRAMAQHDAVKRPESAAQKAAQPQAGLDQTVGLSTEHQQLAPGTTPADSPPGADDTGAEDEQSVPKWVY